MNIATDRPAFKSVSPTGINQLLLTELGIAQTLVEIQVLRGGLSRNNISFAVAPES